MPHSVVRVYTESGPLIGMLREREGEVRDIMTSIPGFVMYGIMDTGRGAVSVTTCEDKAGTDESIKRAADWIKANLPAGAKIDPPRILEGDLFASFRHDGPPREPRGAHLAVRIFSQPAPEGRKDRMDAVRALMAAVPGFRSYAAIDTDTGGVVSVIAGDDKATTDEIGNRMREFVTSLAGGQPPRTPPEIIEATGVFRFDAQAAPV